MTRERLTATACLLGAAILIAIAFQCIPEQRTLTEAPTRVPITTILPTVYVFLPLPPSPTVTPREAILSTQVLTSPPTMMPTAAPPTEAPVPARSPVQRG